MIDLQILICSYKATKAFEFCLERLARFNFKKNEILISENSPENYSLNRELLDKYKINYINCFNGSHAEQMNKLFKMSSSKYVLLLDSDCFCLTNPKEILYNYIIPRNIDLYGEIIGDRNNLRIHKRVCPWWCIVNMDIIRKYNIDFVDFNVIKESKSESFIDILRLNEKRDVNNFYYDVGSTLYENVIKYKGVCADIGDNLPYFHIEGNSWRDLYPSYKNILEHQNKYIDILKNKFNFNVDNLMRFSFE